VFVLVLLGFAATDFLITMTLSAADATARTVENPLVPKSFDGHPILITLFLLGLLAAVFRRGFPEAITLAVGLVGVYLAVNLVVLASWALQLRAMLDVLRRGVTRERGGPHQSATRSAIRRGIPTNPKRFRPAPLTSSIAAVARA